MPILHRNSPRLLNCRRATPELTASPNAFSIRAPALDSRRHHNAACGLSPVDGALHIDHARKQVRQLVAVHFVHFRVTQIQRDHRTLVRRASRCRRSHGRRALGDPVPSGQSRRPAETGGGTGTLLTRRILRHLNRQ